MRSEVLVVKVTSENAPTMTNHHASFWQRNTIYARVDSALHRIRETSEVIFWPCQLLNVYEYLDHPMI